MMQKKRNRRQELDPDQQLITNEFLGKITPEGFVEPKVKRIMHRFDQVSVKEYGASFMLQHVFPDITQELKNDFPEWKRDLHSHVCAFFTLHH